MSGRSLVFVHLLLERRSCQCVKGMVSATEHEAGAASHSDVQGYDPNLVKAAPATLRSSPPNLRRSKYAAQGFNPNYLGDALDGGTRIGQVKLFGIKVDAVNHPHAWAVVSLVAFVLLALLVANLRRSRTGRRLIAVRTTSGPPPRSASRCSG